MPTIEYKIIAEEEVQEILISRLSDFEALGFEQIEGTLLAYFSLEQFNQPELEEVLSGLSYSSNILEDRNWNAEWEAGFEPVQVNEFCRIRASFHSSVPGTEHEIIITPKMSFGTGHHSTTYLMIEFMDKIFFQNKSVFDFGTGTGILAILASKLGAHHVDAIDVDDWSISNAKENSEINEVSNISFSLSSKLPSKTFDVVLANINRNVILQYLPSLKSLVNAEGLLLVSGILIEDETDIVEMAQGCGFRKMEQKDRGGWLAILFTKEN